MKLAPAADGPYDVRKIHDTSVVIRMGDNLVTIVLCRVVPEPVTIGSSYMPSSVNGQRKPTLTRSYSVILSYTPADNDKGSEEYDIQVFDGHIRHQNSTTTSSTGASITEYLVRWFDKTTSSETIYHILSHFIVSYYKRNKQPLTRDINGAEVGKTTMKKVLHITRQTLPACDETISFNKKWGKRVANLSVWIPKGVGHMTDCPRNVSEKTLV